MTGRGPPFLQAWPAAEGRPLAPLVGRAPPDTPLARAHARRATWGRVHALGLHQVRDAVIGAHGQVWVEGTRLSGPEFAPTYVDKLSAEGRLDLRPAAGAVEVAIEGPAVAFVGYGLRTFGHGLIEMAPKIAIAERALSRPAGEIPFLLPEEAPAWFEALMRLMGARRFIRYRAASERPRLASGFVATMPLAWAIHPACAEIFAAVRERCRDDETPRRRLFVTRRGAAVTWPRVFLEAEAAEQAALDAGFEVVEPSALTIPEQVRLFAGARVVVGEFGSALHNAVFCRPGAVVGAIGARNQVQSAISALCDLRQSYLEPESDPGGLRLDPSRFRAWLDELVGQETAAG